MNTEAEQNDSNEPRNTEAQDASTKSRSTNQRRRLLVAALAGAPAIVAGSAQHAYADGEATAGSGTVAGGG